MISQAHQPQAFPRTPAEALDGISGRVRPGLLVMDLDHLKQINDRFGHDAGDALLKEFAQRLRSVARTTDTVARLGGDEFAVILPDIAGAGYRCAVAEAILPACRGL